MKTTVGLLSAFLCGSLIADERQFDRQPAPQQWERAVPAEDVLFVAQVNPPEGPGAPRPTPVGTRGPAPAPHQTQKAPGVPGERHDRIAQAPTPVPGGGFGGHVQGGGSGQRGPNPNPFENPAKRTLIIGGSKLDGPSRQSVEEDMQIMSRLLDKTTERALDSVQDRIMGIVLMTMPGGRNENLYIDDYGAIFLLNVPIPLAGPQKENAENGEKEDSDWEQTKRELYQNRPFGSFEPMKYDAQKVDTLKRALLESLKNATNIRQLKPDQSVTLVVSGGDSGRAVVEKRIVKKQDGDPAKTEKREEVFERKISGPQQTTLTIRVKKSDVDAFAKGKMNLDEFSRKAIVSSN